MMARPSSSRSREATRSAWTKSSGGPWPPASDIAGGEMLVTAKILSVLGKVFPLRAGPQRASTAPDATSSGTTFRDRLRAAAGARRGRLHRLRNLRDRPDRAEVPGVGERFARVVQR